MLQPSIAMRSPSNEPSVDWFLSPATLPRRSNKKQIDAITLGPKVHPNPMLQISSCLTDVQIKAVSSLSPSTIKSARHVVYLQSASYIQGDVEHEEMSKIAKISSERSHGQGCHHTDVTSSCSHSDVCLVEARLRNARRRQRVLKLQSEI